MRLNWSICRGKGKRTGNSITMNGLSHYRAATKTLFGNWRVQLQNEVRVWHQCMRFAVCIYVLAGQDSCRLWWELENRCFQWRKWRALPVTGLRWASRKLGTQERGDKLKIWPVWFKKKAMNFHDLHEDTNSVMKIEHYLWTFTQQGHD